jgi:hypothetical protein
MFKHRMVYADGTPANPPAFLSAVPNWRIGDRAMVRPGFECRIVRIDHDEAVDEVVWTVEPVRTSH